MQEIYTPGLSRQWVILCPYGVTRLPVHAQTLPAEPSEPVSWKFSFIFWEGTALP